MGLEAYITLGFLIKKRAVVFCLVTKLCLTLLQPDGLSMGLPRQEYWSGLPFPSPGDLTDLGRVQNYKYKIKHEWEYLFRIRNLYKVMTFKKADK